MVIAALVSFGILLVAWIVAPDRQRTAPAIEIVATTAARAAAHARGLALRGCGRGGCSSTIAARVAMAAGALSGAVARNA